MIESHELNVSVDKFQRVFQRVLQQKSTFALLDHFSLRTVQEIYFLLCYRFVDTELAIAKENSVSSDWPESKERGFRMYVYSLYLPTFLSQSEWAQSQIDKAIKEISNYKPERAH